MMASPVDDNFTMAEEFQLSLESTKLEMAYETALHNMDTILYDETCRDFHVRMLLAEHDRDTLRSQCESVRTELESAERGRSAAEMQLSSATDNISRLQESLRASQSEVETLKAEINSLQTVSGDSAKIQAEKSALIREISMLKPEIAQLRSQNTSQQSIVSDNLALERQVNSLEVELRNTKRSLERAMLKDPQSGEERNRKGARVEQLSKEYLKEKEERERIEKEASDGARQRKSLENKIHALEAKLEGATEQLTQAQDRFRHQVKSTSSSQPVQPVEEEGVRPQKVVQFDPGMVIATPGGAQTASKRQKSLALPGDKSSFSITPFLNRTTRNSSSQDVSLGDEDESSDSSENKVRSRGKPTENTVSGRGKTGGGKTAGETNTYDFSSRETDNVRSPAYSSRPLEQRERNEDKSFVSASNVENARSPVVSRKDGVSDKPVSVAKRDRTLFDDDEGLNDRRKNRKPAALQSFDVQARRTEGLRPIRRLGGAANLNTGFSFSPLKRNTKAMEI